MKHFYLRTALPAAALLALTGCIDDKYDLSDIDTTTQLKVNDLVIPINLSEITLDNVIEVDKDDPDATITIENINGQEMFTVRKNGTFSAEAKSIKVVEAPAPQQIDGTQQTLDGTPKAYEATSSRKRLPGGMAMVYDITPKTTQFTYNVGKDEPIDEAITSIKYVHISERNPLLIHISLTSPDVKDVASAIAFRDLILTVPEGMNVTYGDRKAVNGKIGLPEITSESNHASVTLKCVGIDFSKDPNYDPKLGIIVENGQFDFNETIGVESGELYVFPRQDIAMIPPTINFTTDYDLTAFTVDKFSGNINYAVDMDPINAIELSDLPEFLDNPQTNLIIENPQICLSVTNPVGQYGVGCRAGLTLTAMRNGVKGNSPQLSKFEIQPGVSTKTSFIFAPKPEETVALAGYENPVRTEFKGLGTLLSGNGIPDMLDIEMESKEVKNPEIFGDAVDFPLGVNLSTVEGSYTFFTPLALADGSSIVYEKTVDGWNDEDVDALVIEKFKIDADATTTIPCGVTLKARAINTKGEHIAVTNPDEAKASIPAMADNNHFSIELNGDIRNLDGIWFEAEASDFDGKSLSPDQTIKLNNIKVTVTGNYTKEL